MTVTQSITVSSTPIAISAGKAILTANATALSMYVWDFLINPTINNVTNITADFEVIPPYTQD